MTTPAETDGASLESQVRSPAATGQAIIPPPAFAMVPPLQGGPSSCRTDVRPSLDAETSLLGLHQSAAAPRACGGRFWFSCALSAATATTCASTVSSQPIPILREKWRPADIWCAWSARHFAAISEGYLDHLSNKMHFNLGSTFRESVH